MSALLTKLGLDQLNAIERLQLVEEIWDSSAVMPDVVPGP